ncbi:hypothetical protein XENTR_v10018268 [Xenopus tropicalis]|uniref:Beta-microseminoprotein n=1 Tax=Xenopus tropicalis TaxID=8364 RepID=A0A8J0QQV1_XENTR|nr:beta-microseminoprotein [Xenopus tropicalis]KAE8590994.1 hypothetical protein XENTR_v10018268 [Xenopus tropicalis]|eukprot:XP_002936015.2 PREDICTED: beta-microseminoprotein-like [Xenopus tropicalis]
MKFILASVIALGILLTTCNAACFHLPPENQEGCLYSGELHELGSKFRTKDCMDCTCDMDGSMGCCQAFVDPIGYDEQLCEKVFNEQSCSYIVRKKDNPAETCKVTSSIG